MIVLKADAPQTLEVSVATLLAGGVIALPTDTVYGIAAALTTPTALQRLYDLKGRRREKPFPVLLSELVSLARVAEALDDRVAALLDHFWPGALTLVVSARDGLPAEVVGPGQTVGVRVPDHVLARAIAAGVGGALAVTSANRSGATPAQSAAAVVAALGDRLDLLLDGGPLVGGLASTVVAVGVDGPVVLRAGAISRASLKGAWEQTAASKR